MSAPISQAISQLINGISQQAPELRLPSQAELQVNAYSSPVDGLKKRSGTTLIARLMDAPTEDPYVHTINRDTTEQYTVVLTDGNLQVFDLKTGTKKVVNFPQGKSYLSAGTPRHDLQCLTVEDYTFILNKNTKPQIAPVPYFETDQLSAAISFGSGVLVNDGINPVAPGRYLNVGIRFPWTSSLLNPQGWVKAQYLTSQGWTPRTALMNLLASNTKSPTNPFASLDGWDETYDFEKLVIKKVQQVPEVLPDSMHQANQQFIRISTAAGYPLLVRSSAAGSPSVNCEAYVGYGNYTAQTSMDTLRSEVGYPSEPYAVPGQTRYVYEKFNGTGDITIQVNQHRYFKSIDNTWSTPQYAAYFAALIQADFPTYEVTVHNYVLSIKVPTGQPLWVSSSSVPVDLVKTVYQELPTQEAVFVVIKQGVANQTYSVSINGTQVAYSTGNTDEPDTYKAETVATHLADALNNAGAGFQAAAYGGFIRVIRPDKATMTFAFKDTWGGQAMYAMKNRVNTFTDLPGHFIPGYPIEVAGVGASGYYVQWEQKKRQATASYGIDNQVGKVLGLNLVSTAGNVWTANEGEDTGIWAECPRPGALSALNPGTMPHALIREKDGSFTFKPLTWSARGCGDNASVPVPSFVDKRIVDLFFHRNRLGFLSESSVVFSRAGEFFNLWPTTAKDVLDGDPIDTMVNHTRVSTLRHTAVFNNQLLIFSDNTQFVVSAQNLLTPKSVTIQPSTEFDCSPKVKPVNSGNNVFFMANRGDYSQLREYFVLPNAFANTSTDVTAHVPRYVPKGVYKMALCNAEDFLVVLSENEPTKAFIFKYLWDGDKKLQESWSEFQYNRELVNIDFVGTLGYQMFRAEGGLHLEVADYSANFSDGPLGQVMLDRKVTKSGTTVSGDTHMVLDQEVTDSLVAVSPVTGAALKFTPVDSHTVSFKGQQGPVMFGLSYDMRYRFSPLFFRVQGNTMTGSQLMVKTFEVQFAAAVQFDMTIGLPGRALRHNTFIARHTGALNSTLDSVQVTQGRLRTHVMSEGRDTQVELVNDSHYPLTVLSATYEGQYNMRTRRV